MATLEEFKDFYQNNPRYFEKAAEGITQDAISLPHREIHTYVRTLTNKRICDFGCGSGYDLEAMYSSYNRYTGLDVSESALHDASRRSTLSRIQYLQIEFEEPVPLPEASFDVITSFYVFEHVLRPTQTLNEMVRLLRPGGELFFITPNYGSPLKSAPPLGTPSKKKLLKKLLRVIKTISRRLLRPQSSLDLRMIPLDKLDLSEGWGPDMDATNEPWSWEIASYLKARGLAVTTTSWEASNEKNLKTGPERTLWPIRSFPLIRHFGSLCVIHARKQQ